MSSESPAKVYLKEFSRSHGHLGRAIYQPDMPKDHEIDVGDVGLIDLKNGDFCFLFNTLTKQDAAVGHHQDYRPIPLEDIEAQIRLRPETLAGGYYFSENVRRVDNEAAASESLPEGAETTEIGFICDKSYGAVLLLKGSAQRNGWRGHRIIRQYVAENHAHWEGVATARDYPLGPDFLGPVLVSGHVKTNGWQIAVMDSKDQTRKIRAVGDPSIAPFGLRFSPYQQYSTGWPHRSGPDPPSEVKNQCIFISYYRVKARLFGVKVVKAGAGPHHPPDADRRHPQAPEVVASEDSDSAPCPEKSVHVESNEYLDVLLDYLLEISDADIAVACHDDLIGVYEEARSVEDFRQCLCTHGLEAVTKCLDYFQYRSGNKSGLAVTLSEFAKTSPSQSNSDEKTVESSNSQTRCRSAETLDATPSSPTSPDCLLHSPCALIIGSA